MSKSEQGLGPALFFVLDWLNENAWFVRDCRDDYRGLKGTSWLVPA